MIPSNNITSLKKIPVTVITGFLGSGKTTLVRHLMQNPQGKRLAIIVNEFGDVGVDGEILKTCAIPDCPEENILELVNFGFLNLVKITTFVQI